MASEKSTNITIETIAQQRPFEEREPWKLLATPQTRPFRPNRLYMDRERNTVVLVCPKSRSGEDYAVSADALAFLPSRLADPASWVRHAFIMLARGDFERPSEMTVAEVMTVAQAVERVRDATALHGRGGFGDYFWLWATMEDEFI